MSSDVKVAVQCSHCGHQGMAPQKIVNTKQKCPNCGTVALFLAIDQAQDAASADRKPAPQSKPRADAKPKQRPAAKKRASAAPPKPSGAPAPPKPKAAPAPSGRAAPPEPSNDAVYQVTKNGQKLGSFTIAQLKPMLAAGAISYSDQCWTTGWAAWHPISNIIEPPPGAQPSAPGPAPTSHVGAPGAAPNPSGPEQTIWTGGPSMMRLLPHLILGIVVVVITFGIGIILLPLFFLPLLWNGAYRVTNKRISSSYGFMGNTTSEIRIKDIRSVRITKRGLAGMIGIGTVEFFSAASGNADVEFFFVSDAKRVKQTVTSLIPD